MLCCTKRGLHFGSAHLSSFRRVLFVVLELLSAQVHSTFQREEREKELHNFVEIGFFRVTALGERLRQELY